ncbi:hypothetical protein E4U58_000229 [Claviceps cyperi]|nr:hypothetical protein E4U58_000229 [Claviceps cyperi]
MVAQMLKPIDSEDSLAAHQAFVKLPVSLLVAALDNTTEINLDTGFVDEDGEEFGPKQLVAAVIIQLLSALVSKGLRLGYIDTWEAKIFLHIGSDPSRVEYHLSCPSSDVHGVGKMHLSAVSQLFAFVVQTIEASKPTKEWEIATSELPIWKLKPVKKREKIPRIAEQTSTHHSPDKVDNEQEASGSGSKTAKERAQNGGMVKRPDTRQKMLRDFFNRSYCTNKCV